MLDGINVAITIVIVLPIILGLIYLFIDNAFQKDCEKKYGMMLDSHMNNDYLEFYYRNSMEQQEQEYLKKIDKLNKNIKELENQVKLQENTINVLYNIIQQCLNNSISENQEIIKELEELEQRSEIK